MILQHYAVRLRQEQIDYLRNKYKGKISVFIREAVDEKIAREKHRN